MQDRQKCRKRAKRQFHTPGSQLPAIVVLVLSVALTSMQTDFGQATPVMRTFIVAFCLAFIGLARAYKIN